jgi:hypothetical protein
MIVFGCRSVDSRRMPGIMAPPAPDSYRPLMAVAHGTREFAPIGLRGFLWASVPFFAVLLVALQTSGT